jgi:hypothetical protein
MKMNDLALELEYEIYDYFNYEEFNEVEEIERLAALINYCGTSQYVEEIFGYESFRRTWVGTVRPWLEGEFLSDPSGRIENFVLLGQLIKRFDPDFSRFVLESGSKYGMAVA